ncbi:YHS domain-containing (seleno)protein [Petrachloros mirabilis]
MKLFSTLAMTGIALATCLYAAPASATDVQHSTPGLSGYDPVAYFTDGKPIRGSGYHVAVHEGVTYAFASAEHQKMFKADPEKYLPAYGGYCAYGVAVGKKFVANPDVWKVLNGRLYLNLDRDIQMKWEQDIHGNIKKAEHNWVDIKGKSPGDL